jgi:tryptophan-rich hypothetical protein
MNQLSPKKLLNSKWTACTPINKDKHFIIVEVEYDEDAVVVACVIEALMSKKITQIDWRDLQDSDKWQQGWQ